MSRQRTLLNTLIGRVAVGVLLAATTVLLAPAATATPETDAGDAITAAWRAAGGDTGPLGPREGDVYPAGTGFGQNFAGGRIFFTTETGAHIMQGAILDKYLALGGPADGDLGFPTIDEGPGRVGPDSRNNTFSAGDNPVIFWTPDTGARVVRGPINAAWDKLGGSAGQLGVPVDDETFLGDVVTQKFTGGEVSWNRQTRSFTTAPPEMADQLAGLAVPEDPTSAINAARRAAGGPLGPLGAKDGDQYQIGQDGIGQNFAGGKIFYTPATGAHVLTGQVLEKYESVGGPEGDLGFPVTSEVDGGLGPNSRMVSFAAADKPVIFWTPDYGAVIVRGAMNAAWTKLDGAKGQLAAPMSDQTQDGDVITQRFSGGAISWNEATNEFSTEPAGLASSLSGLQVPGVEAPKTPPSPQSSGDEKWFKWHWTWWWLAALIPVLLLAALVGAVVRRNGGRDAGDRLAEAGDTYSADSGWDDETEAPGQDSLEEDEFARRFGEQYAQPPESTSLPPTDVDPEASAGQWDLRTRGFDEPDNDEQLGAAGESTDDLFGVPTSDADESFAVPTSDADESFGAPTSDADDLFGVPTSDADESHSESSGADDELFSGDGDSDAVDTAPTRIETDEEEAITLVETETQASSGRHAATVFDEPVPAATSLRLPLSDPSEAPEGYPIKADTKSGMYWVPDSIDYDEVIAEIWFSSEEFARTNGFVRAD